MIYRPIVQDEEITFSKKKFLVSKTDTKGNIIFLNKNFCEISGYTEEELIGESHNVLRHPDMPEAIFFLIWGSLLEGREVSAVIKNLAKDGRYYWVISDFSLKKDKDGVIKSFTSFRRSPSVDVVEIIEELYETMLTIEKKHGIEGSLSYLEALLEDKKLSYNEFLNELIEPKSLLSTFLDTVKRVFG